jgi:hypothetical protein
MLYNRTNQDFFYLVRGLGSIVFHMVGLSEIKLKRNENSLHHYINLNWVVSTENGKVKVDRLGEQAKQDWTTTALAL